VRFAGEGDFQAKTAGRTVLLSVVSVSRARVLNVGPNDRITGVVGAIDSALEREWGKRME